MRLHALLLLALAAVASCADGGAAPPRPTPASVEIVSSPPSLAAVGTVAGTVVARVTDANGAPISGVVVTFTVSAGGGSVNPTTDTTDADGRASTQFTLGTTAGVNEITVVVSGVPRAKVTVTGVTGAASSVTVSTRLVRLPLEQDSALVSATVRDALGNLTGEPVTWIARDPTLVSVSERSANSAMIQVLRRPGQTYVVAMAGAVADSILVAVQDASSTACTFIADPTTLPVGGSIAFDDGSACVRSETTGADYAVVAHYNTVVASIQATVTVSGTGITAPTAPFPMVTPGADVAALSTEDVRDFGFELALRLRERREIGSRAEAARDWQQGRVPGGSAVNLNAIPSTVKEGDILSVNVNAVDFCSNPKVRNARVAAITQSAIVLADVNNPSGGFTDAEYRAFGIAMDTLVNPVGTTAFGAPSDIDNNKRVGLLFTSAVNELTPQGQPGGVVLGFFYIRDLLPRTSPAGSCPGSNVAEMFYLLVPDPNATINNNARSKSFVQSTAIGTIAHEYQHLINASRRLYVTKAPRVDEEIWLNEGLSHIAEELVFYHSSGLAPRQNIGPSQIAAGTQARAMFDLYQRSNISRYREYLRGPETNATIAVNDELATRGATWAFLRYLADRTGATDGDFWFRLVNSQQTGVANMDAVLSGSGLTTAAGMRDWTVSVLTDDNPSTTNPAFQQPSWNFVGVMTTLGGNLSFTLAPRVLSNGSSTSIVLRGGGTAYLRFSVPENGEALMRATGPSNQPLAPGMRLTIVRLK